MHPYRPARGGGGAIAWLALAVALAFPAATVGALSIARAAAAPVLAAVKLPNLPAAARPSSPHHGGGRAARVAVAFALDQRGKPYRWAGHGPRAYDCSGLTWAAWRAAGRRIPRTAAAQLADLPRVHGRLRPGDLVIYRTRGPTRRHVAMLVSDDHMIEARGRGIPVRVVRLRGGYLGAVRP